MNIKVNKNRTLIFGKYKLKCAFGKSGIKNFKKEGDLATPKGIFGLGILFYRKDRNKKFKCKLKKIVIKKNMGWCDDIKSKKYNKLVYLPSNYSAERFFLKKRIYDLLIHIKYNTGPVIKKKGSAIFLHLTNNRYAPTKGCVAISKKDFMKILPNINQNTKIQIG